MKDEHVKDAAQDVAEELELELIKSRMAQKPMLRGEVGCACVACEVRVKRGGMGERGCARRLGGWVDVGVKPIRACCGGRATGRGAGLGLRDPGGARPHCHATTVAAAAPAAPGRDSASPKAHPSAMRPAPASGRFH